MWGLLRQEFFKFRHQRLAWLTPVILVFLMGGVALTTNDATISDQKFYLSSGYVGFQWAMLLLIVVSATCVAMEFAYGTIKQLAIQVDHRWMIYLGKFCMVLGVSVVLHLIVVGVTLIFKLAENPAIQWLATYRYHQSLLANLVNNALFDWYGGIIVVSLVFLLASCSRNGAVAVAIGVGVCFMGEGLSSLLLNAFKPLLPIMKWNPFNMFYLQAEYGNPSYRDVTHLTIQQLGVGTLGWTVLFLGVGMLIFSKRRI